VAYWGLILWVVLSGLPLRTIGITTLVATVLWFAVVVFGMLSAWGIPSIAGLRRDGLASMRKQLGYGVQLFSAGVIGFFYEPLTKLLLAHFLGVREVGIFDIGMRARNIVGGVLVKLLYPLYPLFAHLVDPKQVRFLVHDVEQKSLLIVAPILGTAAQITTPLVALFFGNDIEMIASTVFWMVSTYLLLGFIVTPFYAFLMAKGHAWKTVLAQIIAVVANAGVFLAIFAWLGYYAAIAGNVASNLCAWILLMYLQWNLLRSVIVDRWQQVVAVGTVIGIGIGLSLAFPFSEGGLYTVVGAPILMTVITLFLYRLLSVVSAEDVTRYLGRGTRATRLCTRLLCKELAPEAPLQGT
jgi:O-antigen/teichoic acid export membrane protein